MEARVTSQASSANSVGEEEEVGSGAFSHAPGDRADRDVVPLASVQFRLEESRAGLDHAHFPTPLAAPAHRQCPEEVVHQLMVSDHVGSAADFEPVELAAPA